MSYRVGRRNPRIIYWVDDEDPNCDFDDDEFMGSCVSGGAAAQLVARANGGRELDDDERVSRITRLQEVVIDQRHTIKKYKDELERLQRFRKAFDDLVAAIDESLE